MRRRIVQTAQFLMDDRKKVTLKKGNYFFI
nr:MAG TPA: Hexamethylene bis-acetamide-inducible protein [Caudoviricetes sp.]